MPWLLRRPLPSEHLRASTSWEYTPHWHMYLAKQTRGNDMLHVSIPIKWKKKKGEEMRWKDTSKAPDTSVGRRFDKVSHSTFRAKLGSFLHRRQTSWTASDDEKIELILCEKTKKHKFINDKSEFQVIRTWDPFRSEMERAKCRRLSKYLRMPCCAETFCSTQHAEAAAKSTVWKTRDLYWLLAPGW